MKDSLFTPDNMPLETARKYPEKDWFTPDSQKLTEERNTFTNELSNISNTDPILIADNDADGLGCAATMHVFSNDNYAYIPSGPHGGAMPFENVVSLVSEHATPTNTIYICDIRPDSTETLTTVLDTLDNNTIYWVDHHEYTPELTTLLHEHTTFVHSGSETECAATLLADHLTDSDATDFNTEHHPKLADILTVTRDRDCWILDDPRHEDIADYSYLASPQEYINTVTTHGADLPENAMETVENERDTKQALANLALKHATTYDIDGTTVAFTYGRCPSSEVGDLARDEGVDVTVMMKPNGAISFRGSDAFTDCNTIAETYADGGGHGKAAGCKPDRYFQAFTDYLHHWQTNGHQIETELLDVIAEHLDTHTLFVEEL